MLGGRSDGLNLGGCHLILDYIVLFGIRDLRIWSGDGRWSGDSMYCVGAEVEDRVSLAGAHESACD